LNYLIARKRQQNKASNKNSINKIYEFSNEKLEEFFAIKSVWKDLFYNGNNVGGDTEFTFLKNEIEILLNIEHDNIVKCYEIYEDKNNIHFIFEYINGSELSSLFSDTSNKSNTIFKINRSLEIFLQIIESIQYLHSKNIIHRDIKPENFLIFDLNGKFKIKLIDFGFAVSLKSDNESIFESVGSLPYISPEMILNKGYSYKTDIFSAGVVFFNLITGKQPFFGKDSKETLHSICYNKPIYPEHISNKILVNFLDCLLEKESEKRLSASESVLHSLISQYKDLQQMQTVPKIFEPKFDNETMLELIEFNKIKNFIWNVLLSNLDLGLANKIKHDLIDIQNSENYRRSYKTDEYPEKIIQGRYTISYTKFLEIVIENNEDNRELKEKLQGK